METRLLIGGEQVSGDGDSLAVENPATEETLVSIALPSAEQLDAAVVAANEAFPAWASIPRSSAPSCCTRSPTACGLAPTSWRG